MKDFEVDAMNKWTR